MAALQEFQAAGGDLNEISPDLAVGGLWEGTGMAVGAGTASLVPHAHRVPCPPTCRP